MDLRDTDTVLFMLLTVSTTHRPATDLGFLLYKNPANMQSFELAFGQAHVFYPEASEHKCTAALLLDVDPVSLVRGRPDSRGEGNLDQYVLTLGELFQEYIDRHAKKKRKTWPVMQKDFARNVASLSGVRLSQITHQKAEKLHSDLGRQRGRYTANRTVQLLKAVLNKGKLWGLYDGGNPFQGISLYPEQARSRFLSNDEAGRLLKTLQKFPDNNRVLRTLRDFILLDLLTGARKSNLMSMRWDEIDFQAKTWTISDEKSKNKRFDTSFSRKPCSVNLKWTGFVSIDCKVLSCVDLELQPHRFFNRRFRCI